MNVVERSKDVFALEIEALHEVSNRIDEEMNRVVELIYAHTGKVVITGIGKTGIIGRKIAASMTSTGTLALFLNAAEAMHGDLGMISCGDVVILLSNSGESDEIIKLVPPLRQLQCKLVAITGNRLSSLAKVVDYVLDVAVEREAGKIGLAPTTSTTAALVMGDALTVCLMERKNFLAKNFALIHPGGALGKLVLVEVRERMSLIVPMVDETTPFKEVLLEVSRKKLGITMVKNQSGAVTGVITDGDIRRAVESNDHFQQLKAYDFMSRGFKRIQAQQMLNDALQMMNHYKITTLAVVENDAEDAPIIGILHIHHILGSALQNTI
ncbi:MAG: KpsF/GutQ family sugar-phosphate isomerase [Prevotellaceae bacterium]|jgi:arabinose-5-phosphate isomerase|nr:KpsF/GutQ family sugar-phosphate isomerase [Prevotellaceae bacterium]